MPTAMRFAQQGALTALAVTSEKRSAVMPDLPTLIEAMPNGFCREAWLALSSTLPEPRGSASVGTTDST
jgi:tripartite-type tricarboxylate transporter receptor subunit TctC